MTRSIFKWKLLTSKHIFSDDECLKTLISCYFLSSIHAQQSSGEPEVVVSCPIFHSASQNYVNSIGSISVGIYTKYYQYINHPRDNLKKSVINNDFDVTLPSWRRYFWTHIGNSTRTYVRMHLHTTQHNTGGIKCQIQMKTAIKWIEYELRYACHNVVLTDVNSVLSIYPNRLMQVHKVEINKCRYLFRHIYMKGVHKKKMHFDASWNPVVVTFVFRAVCYNLMPHIQIV